VFGGGENRHAWQDGRGAVQCLGRSQNLSALWSLRSRDENFSAALRKSKKQILHFVQDDGQKRQDKMCRPRYFMNYLRPLIKGLLMTVSISGALTFAAMAAEIAQPERARLVEQYLKSDVPSVLCLDSAFTTGGQPTEQAYAKVVASGFKTVLSLRTANEGIDLARERGSVERNKMRYFNIPVVSGAPIREQADEYIRLVKEKTNHPMLINCATANRVGAFMMIYRVVEQGWREDKALEEAIRIGMRSDVLKKFAQEYIASKKSKGQTRR
jgi:protein tyrosine phosphatase (PTP) superfamily phosphohydrolase (DUF442 family)